jgi:hypothetical protein
MHAFGLVGMVGRLTTAVLEVASRVTRVGQGWSPHTSHQTTQALQKTAAQGKGSNRKGSSESQA